jgi:NADH-quinone oxidoreductase subunit C
MLDSLTEYPELQKLHTALQERHAAAILEWTFARKELAVRIRRDSLLEVLRFLKEEQGFNALNDLIGLDNLKTRREGEPRFAVLYQLFKFPAALRLRLRVDVGEEETVDSIVALYPSADWAEREIFDMFGVVFEGHPDLRRILMYPEFEGHPLRKSYPYQKRQPLTEERDPLSNPWPRRY